MNIKIGNMVSHPGGIEWGVGKVVEMATFKATIQFSDGIIRKIASSHYPILEPGDAASFVPIPDAVPVVKVRAVRKKKVKVVPQEAAL